MSAQELDLPFKTDVQVIHIPNWKKFNPRADRANFSWFRMENKFFHDQRIFLLNNEQKLMYLFILCEASKTNTDTVEMAYSYASAVIRITPEAVVSCLKCLSHFELIKISEYNIPINTWRINDGNMTALCRQDDGREPSLSLTTRRNETRRDVTKNTNAGIRAIYPESFQKVWELYERKGDKKKAFQEWEALRLSEEEQSNLESAMANYKRDNPDKKYRKDFERFLKTDWREWIKREPPPSPMVGNGSSLPYRYSSKLQQSLDLKRHNDQVFEEIAEMERKKKLEAGNAN